MNHRFIHSAIGMVTMLVLSVLLDSLMGVHGRQAEPERRVTRRVTWQLPNLTGSDTLRLEGYQPTGVLQFILPANWEPATDGQLTLAYRVSSATLGAPAYRRERLAEPGPTLFLRLNGQPVATSKLTTEAGTQTFSLPAEYLQPGPNQIELSVFLPLKDDPQCLIADHPDRWFELRPGTEVVLTLAPEMGELELAEFPWHFALLEGESPPPITFVVPDIPSDAELQALSSVATALSRGITTRPPWHVQAESEFAPAAVSGPVVLIGDSNRNRHTAAAALAGDRSAGWLHLTRPGWAKGYPVLAISGPNDQAVADAAAALLNPTIVDQANGPVLFVTDPPTVEPALPSDSFTLAELGYGEEMVKGTGLQSIIYTFDLPLAWGMRNGTFELRLSHSHKLSWSPAPLTVYLNHQRVASVLFNEPDQSSSIVDIPLPAGLLQAGRNTLRLDFDLRLPPGRCGVDTLEGFWAAVDPQSWFDLPHGAWSGYIDLRHTPFQFASGVDLANLGIVLPAKSTLKDVTNALELIRVLSQSKEAVAPRIVRPETSDPSIKGLHLIVLGEPARQPLLQELNPFLPAPLDLATGTLEQTSGIHVPTDQRDYAVVQTLRSPWAPNRGIIFATGDAESAAGAAVKLLAELASWADVVGNLAVAPEASDGTPGKIVSQRVAYIDAVPGLQTLDRIARRLLGTNSKWLALALPPLAMLLVALGSVIGLHWDRRRRAKRVAGH